MNADKDVVLSQRILTRDIRRINGRNPLQFEVVIARAERTHLAPLAPLGVVRHIVGSCAVDAAALLGSLEIVGRAVTLLHGPARAAFEHGVHLPVVEPNRSAAADARRDTREQRVGEFSFDGVDIAGMQPRVQRAHAARDIETNSAG